jgi:hypothetical protein
VSAPDVNPRLFSVSISFIFISYRTGIMIRKTYRRRPSVESLESMVLLSGFSGATHHAAPALLTKLPAASAVTNVSGTLKGTFTSAAGDGPYHLTGSGAVSPFGHTTVKGSYIVSGPDYQLTGTLTLTTSKGNIVMDTVVETTEFGKLTSPVSMTISNGTKHFKGIGGSGSGSLDFMVRNPGSVKPSGKFTLTVNLNVTMPPS